jgi:hypothetical protein
MEVGQNSATYKKKGWKKCDYIGMLTQKYYFYSINNSVLVFVNKKLYITKS